MLWKKSRSETESEIHTCLKKALFTFQTCLADLFSKMPLSETWQTQARAATTLRCSSAVPASCRQFADSLPKGNSKACSGLYVSKIWTYSESSVHAHSRRARPPFGLFLLSNEKNTVSFSQCPKPRHQSHPRSPFFLGILKNGSRRRLLCVEPRRAGLGARLRDLEPRF